MEDEVEEDASREQVVTPGPRSIPGTVEAAHLVRLRDQLTELRRCAALVRALHQPVADGPVHRCSADGEVVPCATLRALKGQRVSRG